MAVLCVTGIVPARVAAFELDRDGLQQVGVVPLSGLSSRRLKTVRGTQGRAWVLIHGYNTSRTLLIEVEPVIPTT